MIKNIFTLSPLSLLILALASGCGGDKLNKTELKGDVVKPFTAQEKQELQGLSNKAIKDLTDSEKDQVADLVFKKFVDMDLIKFAKKGCHIGGLMSQKDGAKVREQCIAEVSKHSNDEVVGILKQHEAKIKDKLHRLFKKQGSMKADDFILVFEIGNKLLDAALDIKIDASDKEKEKAFENFKEAMAKEYGVARAQAMEELIPAVMDCIDL